MYMSLYIFLKNWRKQNAQASYYLEENRAGLGQGKWEKLFLLREEHGSFLFVPFEIFQKKIFEILQKNAYQKIQ